LFVNSGRHFDLTVRQRHCIVLLQRWLLFILVCVSLAPSGLAVGTPGENPPEQQEKRQPSELPTDTLPKTRSQTSSTPAKISQPAARRYKTDVSRNLHRNSLPRQSDLKQAKSVSKNSPEMFGPFKPGHDEAAIKANAQIKAAVPTHPRAVLKKGNQFLVMDESGLMPIDQPFGYGLYRDDTRYLSEWDIRLNGLSLTPLYESTADGYAGHFAYSNAAYAPNPTRKIPEQKLLVQRDVVINDNIYERITVSNYDVDALDGQLTIQYSADFADMFEVRGMPRKARGKLLPSQIADSKKQVSLSYEGVDKEVMKTQISFLGQTPTAIDGNQATFDFTLKPKSVYVIETVINTNFRQPRIDPLSDELLPEPQKHYSFEANKTIADNEYFGWRNQGTRVSTDNDTFNRLLERGYRDLYILRQQTPKGECLSAGIPWFAVAFGRDEDVTGRELVAFVPSLARTILEILASYQGTKYDDLTEESPGKIMHELRLGEMARNAEVPFRPFYGSVDSTPLWIILFGTYVDWTGDIDFLKMRWQNILSALDCLDRESEKTGYLIYGEKKTSIMYNQGWKDSVDSITEENGQIAPLPIAVCEAQGYLYWAWRRAARMAELVGDKRTAEKLDQKSADLKERFVKDFYMPNNRYVALALDGNGKPCNVIASNAAHLLATGILDEDKSLEVADKLIGQDLFCGWGIRTLSASEAAYNPISYHNGSVWPHDNAAAVEGLCKVGRSADGVRVMDALFEAAQGHLNLRLPELFCGFSKSFSKTPIWYPVSCEPQAWSAGAMFMMLNASLGLVPDAVNHQLIVRKPHLPPFLSSVRMTDIHIGNDRATLYFSRSVGKTTCLIDKKSDGLKVIIDY